MSRLRGRFDREKTFDALLICAIIISASIIIVPILTPRPPLEVTLHILTRDDVSITNVIEESFLASSYAEDNNIVDIEWATVDSSMWNILVGSGSIDLLMGPWHIVSVFGQSGQLEPMPFSITSVVNETIAGVPMKAYLERQPIWCGYAFSITSYDLRVNETMLEENGLSIPESVEDLLSPSYCPNGTNSSLIGMAMGSYGHQVLRLLTKSIGWENAIKNMTVLYANSRLYENAADALDAVFNGEVALTLTFPYTLSQEPPSGTISQRHLRNQVIVDPNIVGIANESRHQIQSEAFIEFLLSPEGQAIWLSEEANRLPVRRQAFDVEQEALNGSLYDEFIWISRTQGVSMMDWFSTADYSLRVYMNSTVFSTRTNLTRCWENIVNAYDNGSILQEQFKLFREMLGEPLTITDPVTHVNESFTEEYALDMLINLYSIEYEIEVSYLWKVVANQRYEMILNELAAFV